MKIQGHVLARNTVLNFIGSVVPPIVGVITIPYIIHGFGVERFGVLSLAWVLLTYFSLFDFGMGRATTKFVAENLGQGKLDHLPSIVWTSVVFQAFLGGIGGITLAVLTPFIIGFALKIPPSLLQESKSMFYLLGATIPMAICSVSLRGVLEAAQRFDLVTAVKIPSNCLTFLIPAAAVLLGLDLAGVAILLFVSQCFTLIAYLMLCFKVFPNLKSMFLINGRLIRPLLTYGGWVTAYSTIIPAVIYLDRFIIGHLHSMAAVTYYTIPYEVLARLQIIPSSFALTLFPVFSTLGTTRREEVGRLYASSMKYLLMIMGPVSLILVFWGNDILRLWLGGEFTERSALVFQLLVIGFFLNSLGWLPNTLLLGMGRPDLVAKLYLIDLLLYVPAIWFLIRYMGIEGAALAMVLRSVVELALFFTASWKIMLFPKMAFRDSGFLKSGIVCCSLIGGMAFLVLLRIPVFDRAGAIQGVIATVLISLFFIVAWGYLLDSDDRNQLLAVFHRAMGK